MPLCSVLSWSFIFERCVIRCGSKMDTRKTSCVQKRLDSVPKILLTVLVSVVIIIWGLTYMIIPEGSESSLRR